MMAANPKAPQWAKIWLSETASTSRMSVAAFGCYMRLTLDYWSAGPCDDDDEMLARITGLSLSAWRKIRPAIEPMFDVSGGQWVNAQIDKDLGVVYALKRTNTVRAVLASRARWKKTARSSMLGAMPEAMLGGHQVYKRTSKAPSQGKELFSTPASEVPPEWIDDLRAADVSLGIASRGQEVGDDL